LYHNSVLNTTRISESIMAVGSLVFFTWRSATGIPKMSTNLPDHRAAIPPQRGHTAPASSHSNSLLVVPSSPWPLGGMYPKQMSTNLRGRPNRLIRLLRLHSNGGTRFLRPLTRARYRCLRFLLFLLHLEQVRRRRHSRALRFLL
jgi:hypothetical protein